MVGKEEQDSTFLITQTVQTLQTPGTNVSICLRCGADLWAIVSQTVVDHMETKLKRVCILNNFPTE